MKDRSRDVMTEVTLEFRAKKQVCAETKKAGMEVFKGWKKK